MQAGDHFLDHQGQRRLRQRHAAGHGAEEIHAAEGHDRRHHRAHAAFARAQRGKLGDFLGQQIVAHGRMRALVFLAAHRQQDHRIGRIELAPFGAHDLAHMHDRIGR